MHIVTFEFIDEGFHSLSASEDIHKPRISFSDTSFSCDRRWCISLLQGYVQPKMDSSLYLSNGIMDFGGKFLAKKNVYVR